MSASAPTSPASATRLAAAALVLAIVAAWVNSLGGAFVYDDIGSIVDNPAVHRLADSWRPTRDGGLPVAGRPLVQVSLALNYAFGGTTVRGYHVTNVAIHALAALTFFGLVRRTLLGPTLRARFATDATWLALAAALLWALHPLQTESVTYVVQRAESLMGLFYLLTLYFFVRGLEDVRWLAASVVACACGMACKEVMATAPLAVLLYDRVFAAGAFHEAVRWRARYYAALAATWLVLACLIWRTGGRGGTAGFDAPMAWTSYAAAQWAAIAHYVRLAFFPSPLVFDYGIEPMPTMRILVGGGVVVTLLALTVGAWRCRPALGFLGAMFFVMLAPTTSVLPIATETMAEHRLYLPLASVVVLIVMTAHRLGGRCGLFVCGVFATWLGALTHERNLDYRSELALWRDTAEKAPANARARFNYGVQLLRAGRLADAAAEYAAALRLRPDFASAHSNLADAQFRLGQLDAAEAEARAALRLNPRLAAAHATLGNVFFQRAKFAEARTAYARAVELDPRDADLRNNLGAALSQLGLLADAAEAYARSLRLRPDSADTHFFLGNIFARLGRIAEALASYERALALDPTHARARENLRRLRALSPHRPPGVDKM